MFVCVCACVCVCLCVCVFRRTSCHVCRRYTGVVDVLMKVSRDEGVAALYRGMGPHLLRFIPYGAITYAMMELTVGPGNF